MMTTLKDKYPYMYHSKNFNEFLQNLDFSLSVEVNLEEIDNFLKLNTWQARVEQILSYIKNS